MPAAAGTGLIWRLNTEARRNGGGRSGKVGKGFGILPLNYTFSFPSKKLAPDARLGAMQALAAEIAKITGTHADGDEIDIRDHKERFHGRGLLNTKSQITVRRFTMQKEALTALDPHEREILAKVLEIEWENRHLKTPDVRRQLRNFIHQVLK